MRSRPPASSRREPAWETSAGCSEASCSSAPSMESPATCSCAGSRRRGGGTQRWSVREMHIRGLNWMQVEEYLTRDDRVVLPLGSTEQHGYLSLETDNILAERVSVEAAEPLGVL